MCVISADLQNRKLLIAWQLPVTPSCLPTTHYVCWQSELKTVMVVKEEWDYFFIVSYVHFISQLLLNMTC